MEFLNSAKNLVEGLGKSKDYHRSYNEIIGDMNYPCETYFYDTEDGHINRVVRISGINLIIYYMVHLFRRVRNKY